MVLFRFEVDTARSVLGEHFVVALAWKRRLAQDQDVEDYSEAEDVADRVALRLEVFEVDDFWSHVTRSAAPHEQVLGFVGPSRQSEIRDDAVVVALLPQQDVFGLEVAMHHALLMHVLQPHQ